MNILYEMLTEICVVASVHAATNALPQAVSALRDWGHKISAGKIRTLLKQVGCANEQHIRELVETWMRDHPEVQLDDTRREEIVGLLLNLSKNARIQNTQGFVRSSFVRNSRLLEQLLTDVQPSRKKGEPVSANSDWILERYIGMGSFGEVWKASNRLFPHPRAFKFFTRDEALTSVRIEAKTLSQVLERLKDHPNIVQYHDVAVNDAKNPYLAIEYVGGGSLEDWILDDEENREPLDRADAIRGLVDGLAKAHEQGLCHRDLKPANIVLTEGPRPVPKITDFGLGHVASHATSTASYQGSQAMLVGTGMYLPAEAQDIGARPDPAQHDVFALGVIWYQLLVDRIERPPYDFAEELRSAGVDSHTIRVISRCLARPKHRYKDAVELKEAIVEVPPGSEAIPEGMLDVSYLFREYHARRVG